MSSETNTPAPPGAFVPPDLDAAQWEDLEPLYRDLLARPIRSVADLERLLLDRSDLDAAVSEAEAERYIATTRNIRDDAAQAAFRAFLETVEPERRRLAFALDRRIVECPFAAELDRVRHEVLLRDLGVDVRLFRPENIPLEAELARLDQEYNQISGAMTVRVGDAEQTLAQAGRRLEETDRGVRETAWRTLHERRYQDRERLDDIFDQMVALRHRTAVQAGFDDFRDFQHHRLHRFDYSPDDCLRFHDGVAAVVAPLMRQFHAERARALDVAQLRPWDLAVDVRGRPPLRPFASVDQLVDRSSRVFHRMRADLGHMFDALREGDCLDLESRKDKAPGGYSCQRQRTRRTFIFMNTAGVHRDVVAMVHEAGHAFHAALCTDEPLLHYRGAPTEFAEVASMSMELLTLGYLDEFYGPEEADRARRNHLEDLVTRLAWTAQIDAFQHWVYTHPEHTRAERGAQWVALTGRFGGAANWEDLGHLLPVEWHRQLHLFSVPFYYIEYGIAQLGALQLWSKAQRNLDDALDDYTRALALGGSRPLPELYAAAGLRFDIGAATIRELMAEVGHELEAMPR